jgi:uncharacterized phage-like protein YoqJ
MTTLAFTGHRPEKLGGYGKNPLAVAVVAAMREKIVELAPTKTISGMALGVDQWGAWLSVKMGIPFVAALPCAEQALKWSKAQRENYVKLFDLAESVFLASKLYDPGCMQLRNEWMVDRCDVLLAVWDGSNGGTANCVRYAEKVGRTIVTVDVNAIREVTR